MVFRLQQLFDNLNDAIYVIDRDYKILMVNKSMICYSAELGLSQDIIGCNLFDVFPYMSDQNKIEYEQAFRLNTVFTAEESEWRGGKRYVKEISKIPIKTEGIVTNVITIFHDITERVEYEKSIEVLHKYTAELANTTNLEQICNATLDSIETVTGVNLLTFLIPQEGSLVPIGNRGNLSPINILPLDGKGITVKAFLKKETILLKDTRSDSDFISGNIESLSELAVPVILFGDSVAVINLESTELNAFNEMDQKLLEILAMHVSSAIQRIKLNDSERQAKAKLEILHESAIHLNKTKTEDDVYQESLKIITEALGFFWGGIALLKDGELRFKYFKGLGLPENFKINFDSKSVSTRALRLGTSQLIPDVRLDLDYLSTPIMDADPFLSELAVPIYVEGEPTAVINLESRKLNAFHTDDQKLLETLAQHMSSAIDRIRDEENYKIQEAERVNELLDGANRVGRMIRHDLRSPLQAIKTYAYLIGRQPSQTETYIKKINESVDYAVKMLEDLKMVSAPTELLKAPIRINDLIEETLKTIPIPESVKIERSFEGDLPLINLDPVRMRRVFDNLVKNAIEAMPQGGSLSVSSKKTDDGLMISFKDTGTGIPQKVLGNLFRPFYTTKTGGTGLGLSICKQLVEAHGGKIKGDSRLGEGSTFTINLPLNT